MAMIPIIPLTERQRADDYPYDAPATGYVIQGDRYAPFTKDNQPDLTDRIAVLSIGSNRSPQQLRRKFGDEATLPVTMALLKDCDVVHSACFSYYGAVPCTAYPCPGTDITLNAVWLTPSQLQIMHDTEAVGIAYDYCCWEDGKVIIQDTQQPSQIYGYATRLGYLSDDNDNPFALSFLPAHARQFKSLSQLQARQLLRARLPSHLQSADKDEFMARLVTDKPYRLEVNEALAQSAKPMPEGPWDIIPATPVDADSFL